MLLDLCACGVFAHLSFEIVSMSRRLVHVESRNHIIISVISTEEAVMDQIVLIGKLDVQLSQTNCASFHISYIRQRRRYMFSPACRVRLSVCLSVCLCARLLKNACMDLDEMLRVDRCRDVDKIINL